MIKYDLDMLKETLQDSPEVAAAYLFGSAVINAPVVNDLDILLLVYPNIDKNIAYFDLVSRISEVLTLPEEKIDILFFDLQEADPDILYEAVNNGVLLKNESPELLGESIEKLSLYLMQNEFIIARSKQLRHEQLEVFCAD
ncbi:MAG: nucleotidyltransferase domain-containing protein [Deltaproteobacteria bacterium]|jgi:predicted nucleotidyltransferase|nr:nucleotidyltransferase domain-containing protein [Deltaproteobacteria bacterium]